METNKKTGSKPRKKNITSEEIVERHLHDRSDVITTEDIQNVKVPPTDESGISTAEEDINPENTNSEEKKEQKEESIPEKEIITPWDVIDP